MKQNYKEYLNLNKNIFFGFLASVIISAIAAQMFSNQQHYLNATFTLVVDYSVYLSTFGSLYYVENKKKYRLESGKTDWLFLRGDLIKLVSSLGIGEIVYIVMRWFLQYFLLNAVYEPYMASVVAQSISFVVFLAIVNLFVKLTGLYKNDT